MSLEIETIIDGDTYRNQLNREKRILQSFQHQTWQEWFALAERYNDIGSIANHAWCMNRAYYYGMPKPETTIEETPKPTLPQLPEERYD